MSNASLPALVKAAGEDDAWLASLASAAILRVDRSHKLARERLKEHLRFAIDQFERSPEVPQHPTTSFASSLWLETLELMEADALPARALLNGLAKNDPDTSIREKASRLVKSLRGGR